MDCSRQASLTTEFSGQEYWSGLSFPPPGDLTSPGVEPMSPASPALAADSWLLEPLGKPIRPAPGLSAQDGGLHTIGT